MGVYNFHEFTGLRRDGIGVVYSKDLACGQKHFMFRLPNSEWAVSEGNMGGANRIYGASQVPGTNHTHVVPLNPSTQLRSTALRWSYIDETKSPQSGRVHDPKMRCIEVNLKSVLK